MKTYDERFQDISMRIAKRRKLKYSITTACMTLAVVILALLLFVPYDTSLPDVSAYADSPYYDIIQRINAATYVPPRYENGFDALGDAIDDITLGLPNSGGAAMDGAPEMSHDGDYVEVTDNQVAGVIESDIIKRSTEYIYYLRGTEVSIYAIAGEESELVGSFTVDGQSLKEEVEKGENYSYYDSAEMYLSQDCSTLTIVLDGYHSEIGSCTTLVNLDVTDPGNISQISRVYITGSYLSSRLVDGKLLLMSKFRVHSDKDFSDESTFLPQIGTPGNMRSVAAEDILAPEKLSNVYYTVVCAIDGKTLDVSDTAAFLSYSDDVYVSECNIFASRSYTEEGLLGASTTMTEISCLNYSGDTLEYMGSAAVEGSIKNQYSMDEYDGILRVVTSVSNTLVTDNGETASARWERNASLYCVSLEDFSIVASVQKFAPDNEQAESVRFDGDYAYVCTAEVITLTDPVYFFNLSDLNNITWTDTGTIDGYSSSLINLGEGYLMGVGYSGTGGLKIEVYEEAEDSVVSVCAYELDASFSEEYKSYLVDREKDLIGLGINDWNGENGYILLHFDGYELNEIAKIPMSGSLDQMRGVLIDGYLYVFGESFLVEKVW